MLMLLVAALLLLAPFLVLLVAILELLATVLVLLVVVMMPLVAVRMLMEAVLLFLAALLNPDASNSSSDVSGICPNTSGSSVLDPGAFGRTPEVDGVSHARSVSELLKIKRNLALFELQYLDLQQNKDFQKGKVLGNYLFHAWYTKC